MGEILEIHVQADGAAGYHVLYRFPGHPPVRLASFEAGTIGRREATMYKNGLRAGIRLASEFLTMANTPK